MTSTFVEPGLPPWSGREATWPASTGSSPLKGMIECRLTETRREESWVLRRRGKRRLTALRAGSEPVPS